MLISSCTFVMFLLLAINYFITLGTQGQEAEFHEIEIQLFQEVEFSIIHPKMFSIFEHLKRRLNFFLRDE